MLANTIHHDHDLENGEHIISAEVPISQIGIWLRKGWEDMIKAPIITLFFGIVMMMFVQTILFAYSTEPVMLLKTITLFIMISPFLAIGLYYTAMKIEQHKAPHLYDAMTAWRFNITDIALYALSLGVIVAIWFRMMPLVIGLVNSGGLLIVNPQQGLESFMFSDLGLQFIALFILGSSIVLLFIFAISVITIPILLKDKNVGAISAMVLSFQVFCENKKTMTTWALVILSMLIVGFLSFGIGMVLVLPLLGYASWHAFNDLIEIEESGL